MQGQIVKIISDLHYVSCNNMIYPCKCRGIFRKEHITPVVGDYVLFNKDKKIIEKILPRKNIFQRHKVSNIEQAFIITSLKLPDFSLNLLDKFIILMEINKVKPIICITKSDLLDKNELEKINRYLAYYRKIGYTIVYNYELDKIKGLIKNKISVFTGQTGAGKSTLLNKLCPDLELETGEVSLALGRGKHTTRVVQLVNCDSGKIMDTPGFSSLSLQSYSRMQIRDAFREFNNYLCKYSDCFHINEEECSVKKAVIANNILKSRYDNYLSFLRESDNK